MQQEEEVKVVTQQDQVDAVRGTIIALLDKWGEPNGRGGVSLHTPKGTVWKTWHSYGVERDCVISYHASTPDDGHFYLQEGSLDQATKTLVKISEYISKAEFLAEKAHGVQLLQKIMAAINEVTFEF